MVVRNRMITDVALLEGVLEKICLPSLEEALGRVAPIPDNVDREGFYRGLKTLAKMIDGFSDTLEELSQFRQEYFRERHSWNKKLFLQVLEKISPEKVIEFYRNAKENAQLTPSKTTAEARQILKRMYAMVESDPHAAELLPPEKITLFEEGLETLQIKIEMSRQSVPWFEEYMDDVIKQAQLPSWVGSVSIGADSSDYQLSSQLEYALALYQKGQVSLWKAAELAGLSLREMMEQAAAHGLEPHFDQRMVEEDLA